MTAIRPTRKNGMCNVCLVRKVTENDMCDICNEEGLWENTHQDENHAANVEAMGPSASAKLTEGCWICHPELNPKDDTPKQGHTNTIAKTYSSHKDCNHAATPADRAACRKARALQQRRPDILFTGAGDIRVGSKISVAVLGVDAPVTVTVTEISKDIKKGRPGWASKDRWGYATDVLRVITF